MDPWSGHIVFCNMLVVLKMADCPVRVHAVFKVLVGGRWRAVDVVKCTYLRQSIWDVCKEEFLDEIFEDWGLCTVIITYIGWDEPSPMLD